MSSVSRSSRRRGSRVTLHVDQEVSIRLNSSCADPLGDEGSGAGPPTSTLTSDVDLAEAIDLVANQFAAPTLDVESFAYSVTNAKVVTSKDSWALDMIGLAFHYKEMELEDDAITRLLLTPWWCMMTLTKDS